MKLTCYLFILTAVISCSNSLDKSQLNKSEVQQEVIDMLNKYHEAIAREGLTGEFAFLDQSVDFFWVPPGYTSALNYDSVRTVLEQNAPSFSQVMFKWEKLQVFPLSNSIASFTGIVKGVMANTSGEETQVAIIESGTVIKRDDGWKLLNGQSAALGQADGGMLNNSE